MVCIIEDTQRTGNLYQMKKAQSAI